MADDPVAPVSPLNVFDDLYNRDAASDVIIPDSTTPVTTNKPERLYAYTDPNAAGETLYAWTNANSGITFYTKVSDPELLPMLSDNDSLGMYSDARDSNYLFDASGNVFDLDSTKYSFIESVYNDENNESNTFISLHYGGHSG